jgi:sugar lactone lactonase YvrE
VAPRFGRYSDALSATVVDGWTVERLTPPTALFGANGIRAGQDGQIYVAQAMGSQISAIDPETAAIRTISPQGGEIVGPDDLAFGPDGAIYATELMDARIGVRERDGRTRVLRGDLPAVNGITFHQGRLFVDECRPGGRVMELDLAGGAPRVLVEDVPMANALEVGPDGMLYFPAMMANEIWRVSPEGGPVERVVGDLGVPDAVKFDKDGFIVSTQVASGQVLRIDPRSGARTVLADLGAGVDNLTFLGERLFVSSIHGQIVEILKPGETRLLLRGGMRGPSDLAMADDGQLYVADGSHLFAISPAGEVRTAAMLFRPGWPGFVRGLAALGGGEFAVTTANGTLVRYRPDAGESEIVAEGYEELYGVAVGAAGEIVFADLGAGRVFVARSGNVELLAAGLDKPLGVAAAPDGGWFVSESGAGRVVKLAGSRAETVLDGLRTPHGLLVRDGLLHVVDAGAKAVVAYDLARGELSILAAGLPVGPPPGVVPKRLQGTKPLSGPHGPFAGIAAGPGGALYVSADGEGSVLVLRPAPAP